MDSKSSTTTVLLFVKNNKSIPLQIDPTNSSNDISPCNRGETSDEPVLDAVPELFELPELLDVELPVPYPRPLKSFKIF